MRVEFAATARRDLTAIGDWIARDNPTRALAFVSELKDRALALADSRYNVRSVSNQGGG